MRNVFCLVSAMGLALFLGDVAALAQTSELTAATKPAATRRAKAPKPRRTAAPAASYSSPAGNLNAPSTDFSNVEPDTGDPRERRKQQGPDVRPSIDSNGRPVMGLGF